MPLKISLKQVAQKGEQNIGFSGDGNRSNVFDKW
jgi:hypothetical protein